MEIILLETVRNLGNLGATVKVKSGYGRNYLIPTGKAVQATKSNIEKFNSRLAELEKAALEVLKLAQERASKLLNLEVTIDTQVGEEGKLFGSIGLKELSKALQDLGHDVKKEEIILNNGAIRIAGEYDINILLHSDVTVPIKFKIVPKQ